MKDIHLNDIDVVNLCLIQTTRCQGDEESVVELVRRTREGEGRVCAAVWGPWLGHSKYARLPPLPPPSTTSYPSPVCAQPARHIS